VVIARRCFEGALERRPAANPDPARHKTNKGRHEIANHLNLFLFCWCRRPDLNRHVCYPLPPQNGSNLLSHYLFYLNLLLRTGYYPTDDKPGKLSEMVVNREVCFAVCYPNVTQD
jgi:hypothetical protein